MSVHTSNVSNISITVANAVKSWNSLPLLRTATNETEAKKVTANFVRSVPL